MKNRRATLLLTGATGFVGKVVLEELTRRRDELGIEKIFLLVRPRKDRTARERFEKSIASSDCFSQRTDDWRSESGFAGAVPREAAWQAVCHPVAGELTRTDCGLSEDDLREIAGSVTHVVHCAASVEFDLPVAQAAASNITASLNVLGLAQRCTRLVNMVAVSTAYVSTHTSDTTPIREELLPLPRPAAAMYQDILDGTVEEKRLLAETGHPNTYTFTKCLAEHLLMERRGRVPLTLVRPSIVSACLEQPFPGWIDSIAGYTGFVALVGLGHMRALATPVGTRPDIVPCDLVSHRIVECTFAARPPRTAIRYAVATQKNAMSTREHCRTIVDQFRRHPVDRRPSLDYVGPRTPRFFLEELRLHRLPTRAARAWFSLVGQKSAERATAKLEERLLFLNRAFGYFAANTFDFRPRRRRGERELRFDPKAYCETVCAGVYRHILRRDEKSVPLGGSVHRKTGNDLLWSIRQPAGNPTIRTLAVALRKALRQSVSEVTFDAVSFKRAVASVKPGTRMVLLPTHRSYADFVLISYLCFARPELGLSIPHIAAAEEFSRIPVLGHLFKKGQAFFIKRGVGKADPELTAKVGALVADGKTLEFFVEGQRSRSRQFLTPRHGLLRCLQGTGETFVLLPIAISYDRIPEEASLLRELRGAPKSPMQLRGFLRGVGRLARGEFALGRIHLTCGEPIRLTPGADARQAARRVMSELQTHTATTTHHLRAFLAKNPIPGVDVEWLRAAIVARGGHVIDSPLRGEEALDHAAERCLRYQFIHHFYADAEAMWPDHPVLSQHIGLNGFASRPASRADVDDPRLRAVLRALFEPIVRDHATVAARLGSPAWAPRHSSPRSLLYEVPSAHLPNVQAAFADLVEREILAVDEDAGHVWGPRAEDIESYRRACVLEESRTEPDTILRGVGT